MWSEALAAASLHGLLHALRMAKWPAQADSTSPAQGAEAAGRQVWVGEIAQGLQAAEASSSAWPECQCIVSCQFDELQSEQTGLCHSSEMI